jgi:hypothetical protein
MGREIHRKTPSEEEVQTSWLVMLPQAKECQQPLEAGRSKEGSLYVGFKVYGQINGPAYTLI